MFIPNKKKTMHREVRLEMGGVKSFEETGPFKCHLDMKRAAAAAANAELLMLPLGRERLIAGTRTLSCRSNCRNVDVSLEQVKS